MFEYSAQDDLNAEVDVTVTITADLALDKVFLMVNDREIQLTGDDAEAVYSALKIRIDSKIDAYIDEMKGDKMIDRYEESLQIKREGL